MNFVRLYLEELDREADRTRAALKAVPLGRDDWKPHPKSMPLATLAGLVSAMPSWVSFVIDRDELDIKPPARTPTITAINGAPQPRRSLPRASKPI